LNAISHNPPPSTNHGFHSTRLQNRSSALTSEMPVSSVTSISTPRATRIAPAN